MSWARTLTVLAAVTATIVLISIFITNNSQAALDQAAKLFSENLQGDPDAGSSNAFAEKRQAYESYDSLRQALLAANNTDGTCIAKHDPISGRVTHPSVRTGDTDPMDSTQTLFLTVNDTEQGSKLQLYSLTYRELSESQEQDNEASGEGGSGTLWDHEITNVQLLEEQTTSLEPCFLGSAQTHDGAPSRLPEALDEARQKLPEIDLTADDTKNFDKDSLPRSEDACPCTDGEPTINDESAIGVNPNSDRAETICEHRGTGAGMVDLADKYPQITDKPSIEGDAYPVAREGPDGLPLYSRKACTYVLDQGDPSDWPIPSGESVDDEQGRDKAILQGINAEMGINNEAGSVFWVSPDQITATQSSPAQAGVFERDSQDCTGWTCYSWGQKTYELPDDTRFEGLPIIKVQSVGRGVGNPDEYACFVPVGGDDGLDSSQLNTLNTVYQNADKLDGIKRCEAPS